MIGKHLQRLVCLSASLLVLGAGSGLASAAVRVGPGLHTVQTGSAQQSLLLEPDGNGQPVELAKKKKVKSGHKTWRQRVEEREKEKQQEQQRQRNANRKPWEYNPDRDKAPSEGIFIKETNLTFRGKLYVRPRTDMIVIHHVGVPSGDISAAQIHQGHLNNGWCGIGYHYVIRKNGIIERGRPLVTVGAHAYGQNEHTVGINVTGNFEWEKPTPYQLKSLVNLVTALCRIYNLDPNMHTVVGHRDVNDTACPGRNLYAKLPDIRWQVRKNLHLVK